MVDGFVFSRDTGRNPWRPNWVTKRFIAYRRRAGLAGFRLHDLRHFMATTMLAAGVPVPVVSERLCHARTSTTVNIYAHAMPGGDRSAVNLLAELLTPTPDQAAGPSRQDRRPRARPEAVDWRIPCSPKPVPCPALDLRASSAGPSGR